MKNRAIFTGDDLPVMRGMESDSVDLIYLDPPFNSNKDYVAPESAAAAGAGFKDTWNLAEVDESWYGQISRKHPALVLFLDTARWAHGDSMKAYLAMMAVRLIEMERILKPRGSIYLHCDQTASHYLKVVMDCAFGKRRFKREIAWAMPRPSGYKTQAKNWIRGHDTLLYYAGKHCAFNKQYEPYEAAYVANFKQEDSEGKYWLRGGKRRRLGKGCNVDSCWTDIHSLQVQGVSVREGVGYPTQKPVPLLERIVQASSREGDVVFDPFCGSGTALIAAEKHGRQWIGCDISAKAYDLMKLRLETHFGGLIPFEFSHVRHPA